jgi:hypothetical protein
MHWQCRVAAAFVVLVRDAADACWARVCRASKEVIRIVAVVDQRTG